MKALHSRERGTVLTGKREPLLAVRMGCDQGPLS